MGSVQGAVAAMVLAKEPDPPDRLRSRDTVFHRGRTLAAKLSGHIEPVAQGLLPLRGQRRQR